jgi:hypothetical protein
VGGRAANTAVSEFADRPPTPDPSPPRANARGGRGEHEFNFKQHSAFSRRKAPEFCLHPLPLKSEGAGNAGRLVRPPPHVRG